MYILECNSFFILRVVYLFLMGETLGECVEDGSLNNQIFESPVKITGNSHTFYRVEIADKDLNKLRVFPARVSNGWFDFEESSVGLLYSQHFSDVVVN